MLNNFEIDNFRAFSHLVVPRLGQVNLIVGANNVGKTTLLEALRLFGSVWPARTAWVILSERDEVAGEPGEKSRLLLESFFHGRQASEGTLAWIGPQGSEGRVGALRLTAGAATWSRTGSQDPVSSLPLHLSIGDRSFELDTGGGIAYRVPSGSLTPPEIDSGPPYLRGLTGAGSADETARRWDVIVLTDGEQRVLEALKMVTPMLGAGFVQDPRGQSRRMAKVRLVDSREPVPLLSLGDGVVRVFQIAVAIEYAAMLAQAASKPDLPGNIFPMLLVDEIEVGVHYTLHADLWRFVLRTAHSLGVQVFATTHSWDCIRGFQEAAASERQIEGVLIRLEYGRGKHRANTFSGNELTIVARDQIEVR